ncbi:hypothetical protein DERF_010712 [Dermatophagoides farinae]|uniref:Uncharacterized protein n=1 Tax=Dermatophagoides farinae TaxID=6954 RepID=A0A922HTG2_DERFA|nr:hypothetical protein DERF_010712 [Dermatophagoides farinae]
MFLAGTFPMRQFMSEVLPAPDGPSNAFKLFIRTDPLRRLRITFRRRRGCQPSTINHSSTS